MENVRKPFDGVLGKVFYSNFFGLFILFFYFWYAEAPIIIFKKIWLLLLYVSHEFSLQVLVRTYFKPWRKITTSKKGGLPGIFAAWRDNAVSRFVGASVRTFAILTAIIFEFLTLVLGGFVFIIWLILPILAFYTFFLSLAYL